MDNYTILYILRESARIMEHSFREEEFTDLLAVPRTYSIDNTLSFKHDLTEAGKRTQIMILENSRTPNDFGEFLLDFGLPVVLFEWREERIHPVMVYRKNNALKLVQPDGFSREEDWDPGIIDRLIKNDSGEIQFLAMFSNRSLISADEEDLEEGDKKLTPVQRLIKLLVVEKKDIINILIYALFIGLIGLTLPLGIQATMEWVAGGVLVTSIYILIALVIMGVLLSGGLQVLQITLVEFIQRRIFTKAALEFALRVPAIKVESIQDQHIPELMNRFFDVLTLQKGLPKLLIDMSAGAIQIFFGLILLSFYHPFFVFFGIALLGILFLIFYLTGPRGLKTSIRESKYKYQVVYWLEEIARSILSFKISGTSNLPVEKTEKNVNSYLKYRKSHFGVLVTQFSFIIFFKAIITGGVLIIGTLLVVNKEITLGQFVASEVVIVLIITSVEKIILYLEVVYDLLTAVDKIAHVTDLQMDRSGGLHIPFDNVEKGFKLDIRNLSYTYPESNKEILSDIAFRINPGERVCLSGTPESGKSTLINTISGLLSNYSGSITIQDISVKDLDMNRLRDKVAKNVSREDIFDGTILENISVGKPGMSLEKVLMSIKMVGLEEKINELPGGLNTRLVSSGKGFSSSFIDRLILARCLAKEPGLLILNDYFDSFRKSEKLELLKLLNNTLEHCTMLMVSNDPLIMASCDRVLYMDQGKIVASGPFEKLIKDKNFKDQLD